MLEPDTLHMQHPNRGSVLAIHFHDNDTALILDDSGRIRCPLLVSGKRYHETDVSPAMHGLLAVRS